MKTFILIAVLSFSLMVSAQNVVKNGNQFEQITKSKTVANKDSITAYTFKDKKGTVYPVYKSAKGKLYVWKISKKGNKYRYYLKES